MELALIVTTAVSVVLAAAMGIVAWRLARAERVRSAARVAALAADLREVESVREQAAVGIRGEPARIHQVARRSIEFDNLELRSGRAAVPAGEMFRGWSVRPIGIAPGGRACGRQLRRRDVAGAGHRDQPRRTVDRRTGRPCRLPRQRGPRTRVPLELVALSHDRDGDRITIRGVVRNPRDGAQRRPAHGRRVPVRSRGRVSWERTGGHRRSRIGAGRRSRRSSSRVDHAANVGRYRVSFKTGDRVVPHVDRRNPGPIGARGSVVGRHRPVRVSRLDRRITAQRRSSHDSHPRDVRSRSLAALFAVLVATLQGQQASPPERPRSDDTFRFRSGVELINVTTTVSDASGRFVPGLRKEDFLVFEDDRPVEVTHFSAERVPVSLGIALDTSGSMAGDKIREAEAALNRFTFELLDKDDEMFLYRFSNYPTLLQGWTTDRQLISRALGRLTPNGGTALYDTVVEADSARGARAVPEEGPPDYFRRQRHLEPRRDPRREAADSRERSAGLCDRHRRRAGAGPPGGAAAAAARAVSRCRCRFRPAADAAAFR